MNCRCGDVVLVLLSPTWGSRLLASLAGSTGPTIAVIGGALRTEMSLHKQKDEDPEKEKGENNTVWRQWKHLLGSLPLPLLPLPFPPLPDDP